jgi:hypothetical protein
METLEPRPRANLTLPPGSRLYLLGESTPLYYTVPTIYATTYDRSVLADAMGGAPGKPDSWTAALRAAGATHVMVDFGELERLKRSGFLDPRLNLDAISAWLQFDTRVLHAWPAGGAGGPVRAALVELPRGAH